MQTSMLGYPFVQDLDAGAEVVSGVLVASKGGRRIILPLVAMRNVGELLGATLRRPGMVAACAAWDADAVPALCILALVTHEAVQNLYTEEASPQPSHVRLLLRPATTECLRSGQQVLHSLSQWKVCWHDLHTPAAVHRDKAWLLVRKLHYMWCASLHGDCSLCTQQGTQPRACCRFVANGGTAPALSIDLSASYALKLAENCCSAGKPEDEALLCQLPHSCSTALHADVSAADPTPRPTAAQLQAPLMPAEQALQLQDQQQSALDATSRPRAGSLPWRRCSRCQTYLARLVKQTVCSRMHSNQHNSLQLTKRANGLSRAVTICSQLGSPNGRLSQHVLCRCVKSDVKQNAATPVH